MAIPLAKRHCEVCQPGTPTLSDNEIQRHHGEIPGWSVTEANGHRELTRTFKFRGFMAGVHLVNKVAAIAEAEGHHPDLLLKYGALAVSLWTHAAGGLTDNDFILAAKIDQVAGAQARFTRS